ncbi:1-deoxy-D-xylulose-5-phosphate reductoisomerase [Parvularcula sp. ZS-1/3]|uniref:1-deoxy-D-xylulose 5-phosphate reductoisomerase n=1 Tax=Parvularcula mediterranea TaxID=2732508 RepID=A0A7Y3RM89_9PROT|nr:1-deoxy-D-xylulose-5-phosphate reductoisomerase [Parvularcula mediterranea]NNU16696.1 1-deoxy-D-xylulose-5-phosphate reductoisomerase [Parvularcula mediterranea]
MLKRRATILGATGSVGQTTLTLIDAANKAGDAEIEVVAVTANSKVEELAEAAIACRAEFAAIANPHAGEELAARLVGTGIKSGAGPKAILDAAAMDADWVMAAIVGAAGIEPLLVAAERGADIAFANKECLVCAGDAVLEAMERGGGKLLPVDSEHNAIFQVFDFERPHRIRKLILTASGGPFRDRDPSTLTKITPAEAVKHPNWSMGAKISVDSATMMNKGLERIEAAYIFPVDKDIIDIVVHPQSVIHSMVDYVDGSVLAQLGTPDMTIPVASALAWPDRINTPAEQLDLTKVGHMDFYPADEVRFPALRLARESLDEGGLATCVLNAANEVAVAAFLKGHLPFLDIAGVTEHCLEKVRSNNAGSDLSEILATDKLARDHAWQRVEALAGRA